MDQGGFVLDILIQSRRNKGAAKRLVRKLLKRQCRAPRGMIIDKLASYGAAKREIMPTRRRERQMKQYKSPQQSQRFLSVHAQVNNLFHLRRDHVPAVQYRADRTQVFQTWAEVTGVAARA